MTHVCQWCDCSFGLPDVPSPTHSLQECRMILEAKARHFKQALIEIKFTCGSESRAVGIANRALGSDESGGGK